MIAGHDQIIRGCMLALVLIAPAWPVCAGSGALERDPFFSSGPRAAAPTARTEEGGRGRDPFSRPFDGAVRAAPAPKKAAPGRLLTGIIFSSDVRIAIIDGEAYREGAVIGDWRLSEIRPRSVVLVSRAGMQEELSLNDFTIRK